MEKSISIIIAAYNEEDVLENLYRELLDVLGKISFSYEVIIVNDGSSDKTNFIITKFSQSSNNFKCIHLARSFGQQAAFMAGIDYSSGDAVILMDADLQDNPSDIFKFIDKWQEGHDVVYAIRQSRKENILKRGCYKLFYFVISKISEIPIPRDVGDFSLMDRKVIEAIKELPESSKFIRGLRSWVGFEQIGIEVERHARSRGKSKYSLKKLFQLASNGIFSYSWLPLRLIWVLGLLFIFSSIPYLCYIFYLKITGQNPLLGWTTLVFIIFGIGGVQLLSLGIIGEYLGRTFQEVKRRPPYIISKTCGSFGRTN